MQGGLKREQQFGGLMGSGTTEKDEELALFLEMRKREKERNDLLLHTSEEFDSALGINSFSKSFYFWSCVGTWVFVDFMFFSVFVFSC